MTTPPNHNDDELDVILQDAFVGLYGKQLDDNGLDTYYVPMEDAYDVLKNSLKAELQAYVQREVVKGRIDAVQIAQHDKTVEQAARLSELENWMQIVSVYPNTSNVLEPLHTKMQRRWDALQTNQETK